MIWVVLIVFFFSLVTYILLTSIDLYIDTDRSVFYLKIWGLIRADLIIDRDEFFIVHFHNYIYDKKWYPLHNWRLKSSTPKKTKRKARFRRSKNYVLRGIRMISAIKVKRFIADLDTGNPVWNAKLYPLMVPVLMKTGHIPINFIGKNRLVLHLQSRPIHLITSFINPQKLHYGFTF